jgi:hypothetical protein
VRGPRSHCGWVKGPLGRRPDLRVALPSMAVLGLLDDPRSALPTQVTSEAGCQWPVMAAGEQVAKRFDALNPQRPIRRWGTPRGLQIFDLQYVCTAAGISCRDDNQCRCQTKAEEKYFPEQ